MAEESTNLNFDANIIVSGVTVSQNVKNVLASLSSASSPKPITQQVNIRYDVERINKVISEGSELARNLQEIFARTQLAPNIAFNTKEIVSAASRLSQVKDALSAIEAVSKAIKGNRFAIPNSGEELGRLQVLGRVLKSIQAETEKAVDFQFSPSLAGIRAFDAQIIGSTQRVEALKKTLADLEERKSQKTSTLGPAKAELDSARSGLRLAIQRRKETEQTQKAAVEALKVERAAIPAQIQKLENKRAGTINPPKATKEQIATKEQTVATLSLLIAKANQDRVALEEASQTNVAAQAAIVKKEQDELDRIQADAVARAKKRLEGKSQAAREFQSKNAKLIAALQKAETEASNRRQEFDTVKAARESAISDAQGKVTQAEKDLELSRQRFEEGSPIKKGQRVNVQKRERKKQQATAQETEALRAAKENLSIVQRATPEEVARVQKERAAAEREAKAAAAELQRARRLAGNNRSPEFQKLISDAQLKERGARQTFNQKSTELKRLQQFAGVPDITGFKERLSAAEAKAAEQRQKYEKKISGPASLLAGAEPDVKKQQEALAAAASAQKKSVDADAASLQRLNEELSTLRASLKTATAEFEKLTGASAPAVKKIDKEIANLRAREQTLTSQIGVLELGGTDTQLKNTRQSLRRIREEISQAKIAIEELNAAKPPQMPKLGPLQTARSEQASAQARLTEGQKSSASAIFKKQIAEAKAAASLAEAQVEALSGGDATELRSPRAKSRLGPLAAQAKTAEDTSAKDIDRLSVLRSKSFLKLDRLQKEFESADEAFQKALQQATIKRSELGLGEARKRVAVAVEEFKAQVAKLDQFDVNFEAQKKTIYESIVEPAKAALRRVKNEYNSFREETVRPVAAQRGTLARQIAQERQNPEIAQAEAASQASSLAAAVSKRKLEEEKVGFLLGGKFSKEKSEIKSQEGRVTANQTRFDAALLAQQEAEARINQTLIETNNLIANIKNTQEQNNRELEETVSKRNAEKQALEAFKTTQNEIISKKKQSLDADRESLAAAKKAQDESVASIGSQKLRESVEAKITRIIAGRAAYLENERKFTEFEVKRSASKESIQKQLEGKISQRAEVATEEDSRIRAIKAQAKKDYDDYNDEVANLGKMAARFTTKKESQLTPEERGVKARRKEIESARTAIVSRRDADIQSVRDELGVGDLDSSIQKLKGELQALKLVEKVSQQLGLKEAIEQADVLDKKLKAKKISRSERDLGVRNLFSYETDPAKMATESRTLLANERLELAKLIVARREIRAEESNANKALSGTISKNKELASILEQQRVISSLITAVAQKEFDLAKAEASLREGRKQGNANLVALAEVQVKLEEKALAIAKERARLEKAPKIKGKDVFGEDLPKRGVSTETLRGQAQQNVDEARKNLEEESKKLQELQTKFSSIRGKALSGEGLSSKQRERLASLSARLSSASSERANVETDSAAKLAKLNDEYNASLEKTKGLQDQLLSAQQSREALDRRRTEAAKRLTELQDKERETEERRVGLMSGSERTKGVAKSLVEARRISETIASTTAQIEGLESQIKATAADIASEEEKTLSLMYAQEAAAKNITSEENKRSSIAVKLGKIIDDNIKREIAFQSRQDMSFSRRGEQYTRADPRAKTLERLGLTEEEVAKPTAEVLSKAKTAKPGLARTEERFASLDKLTKEERSFEVTSRLKKLVSEQSKVTSERKKTTSLDTEAFAKETEARLKAALTRVFGQEISLPEVKLFLEDANVGDVLRVLKNITAEIATQKQELKDQLAITKEVASIEASRQKVNDIVNEAIRKEAKSRSKIKDELAKQGVSYDVNTGVATREGAQYVPKGSEAGDIRSAALSRLKTTEAEIATPTPELASRLVKEKPIAKESRDAQLKAVKDEKNINKINEETLQRTSKLIENEIKLRQRRINLQMASTKDEYTLRTLSAQLKTLQSSTTAAAIETEILTAIFGKAITSIGALRSELVGLDEAQARLASGKADSAIESQITALKAQSAAEAESARQAKITAAQRKKDTIAINQAIEKTTDLIEKQIRTANGLSRIGARDLSGNKIPQINVDRESIKRKVTREITGGTDLTLATDAQLSSISKSAKTSLAERQRALAQFNDDVKAASRGAMSGFEIIAKYGDNAFTRLGGRIGFASEKLIAYAIGGGALYTVIGATRQAIAETALLEKEITNIEQIFSSGDASNFGNSLSGSLGSAAIKAKDVKSLVLDLSEVTGQSAVELAKTAKILAAAGFGGDSSGLESTIRAVSLASLGPSFGNTEEIVDGLIASVNQFNRELSETPYILGLLNEYSKAYAVEAQDLFEAIKRGGGSFASVGGSLEDFVKLVTVSRERTREAAPVIGTFLKTLSSRLFSPRSDKLLGELGLDPDKLLDPYQRLLAISREIRQEGIKGGASVSILSELVDSRQTGRLYALLNALAEFEDRANNLDQLAANSIVEDARKRLDDIGPAIDRIKQSWFRFIEGIYNNPAVKALVTIPGGLLNAISALPNLGGESRPVGNVLTSGAITFGGMGAAALIKSQLDAARENRIAAATNAENLRSLRLAIEKLAAEVGANTSSTNANTQSENNNTQANNTNTAATNKQAAVSAASAGSNAGGGFFGAFGGRSQFLTSLAIGTLIPAAVNSITPLVTQDQRTRGYASSVAGGVGLGAAVGSIFPGIGTLLGAGAGGIIGLLSQIVENTAQDEQLRELERQTKLAQDAQALQKVISTGTIPNKGVNARLSEQSAEDFAKQLARIQLVGRGFGSTDGGIAGYLPKDFVKDLLEPSLESQPEGKQRKQKRTAAFSEFFAGDEKKIKEAESALVSAQDSLRTAIINTFLKEARNITQDTVEARQEVVAQVSEKLSKKLTIEGLKIDADQISAVLAEFTAIDPETKALEKGLETLKLSIRSLYDEAEIAGKILGSLTAELTRSIQSQTIGIQRLFDQVRRGVGGIETAKEIISSPFKASSIKPLEQNATSETAARTIEALTGQKAQRVASPEINKLIGVIEGFFDEFSRSDIKTRQSIIRSLDEERLKAIGGRDEQDSEAAGAQGRSLAERSATVQREIESALDSLKSLGPSSRQLYEILRSGASGLAFDIRELQKALISPDVNAAEKVLGLENARRALIEQANALIEQQNYSLQQQLVAQEALVGAIEARKRSEIEQINTFVDNLSKISSLASNAGLNNPAIASEQMISTRLAANRALYPRINNPNVAVEAISLAKELRLELGRAVERIGIRQQVRQLQEPKQSEVFSINTGRNSPKGRIADELNFAQTVEKSDIAKLINQLQTATGNAIANISEVDVLSPISEINDLLDNSISSRKSDLDARAARLSIKYLDEFTGEDLASTDSESTALRSFKEEFDKLKQPQSQALSQKDFAAQIELLQSYLLSASSAAAETAQSAVDRIDTLKNEPVSDRNNELADRAAADLRTAQTRLENFAELKKSLDALSEIKGVSEALRSSGAIDKKGLDTFERILVLLKQKGIKIDDAGLISALQAVQISTENITPGVVKVVNRENVVVPKDNASPEQVKILATLEKSLQGQGSAFSLLPKTISDLFAGVKFDPAKGLQKGLQEYASLVSDVFNKIKPDLDPSVTLKDFTSALLKGSFIPGATVGAQTNAVEGTVGAADTASVQTRVQSFIDKFKQLQQAPLTRPFDDLSATIATLSADQAGLETDLKLAIEGSKDLFKIFEDNTTRITQKLQSQKTAIEGFLGKLYGGSPQDQAIQQGNIQRYGKQANQLATSILNQMPNAQQLGTTQILQDQQIAQITQAFIKNLPTTDFSGLREFLSTVGTNELTAGLTGEQLSAAISAGLADRIGRLTGTKISQASIGQTSSQLSGSLNNLGAIQNNITLLQKSLTDVMGRNLNLLQDETSKLTKALSSIPNEINIVIKGIENINVDFDMTKINSSMSNVGNAVFGQIVSYLRNAFQRSGIPIELSEGEFSFKPNGSN